MFSISKGFVTNSSTMTVTMRIIDVGTFKQIFPNKDDVKKVFDNHPMLKEYLDNVNNLGVRIRNQFNIAYDTLKSTIMNANKPTYIEITAPFDGEGLYEEASLQYAMAILVDCIMYLTESKSKNLNNIAICSQTRFRESLVLGRD